MDLGLTGPASFKTALSDTLGLLGLTLDKMGQPALKAPLGASWAKGAILSLNATSRESGESVVNGSGNWLA